MKVTRFSVFSVFIPIIFAHSIANADTIRVPRNHNTIQAAIDNASPGDIVLVRDNTWTGQGNKNIDFKGKAITVTSENGPENCVIDCENDGRGFIFQNGEGNNSILSGFTITNGLSPDSEYGGGGILCLTRNSSASPTISNCIIRNCEAKSNSPADTDSMRMVWTGHGGGINAGSGSPTIRNCVIMNNTAGATGGGIYLGGSPNISNCIIKGNSGGGIKSVYGSPTISDCWISENTKTYGSGFSMEQRGVATITNCIIDRNNNTMETKWGSGTIMIWSGCSAVITNCTITGNTFPSLLGPYAGIYIKSSAVLIKNSILWGNSSTEVYCDDGYGPCDITVTHSNIQGGWNGTGNNNINSDPLFVDAANGDFHLQSGSECIDNGTSAGAPATDINGVSRPQGSGFDMGAYEYTSGDNIPSITSIKFNTQEWLNNDSVYAEGKCFEKCCDPKEKNEITIRAEAKNNDSILTEGYIVIKVYFLEERPSPGFLYSQPGEQSTSKESDYTTYMVKFSNWQNGETRFFELTLSDLEIAYVHGIDIWAVMMDDPLASWSQVHNKQVMYAFRNCEANCARTNTQCDPMDEAGAVVRLIFQKKQNFCTGVLIEDADPSDDYIYILTAAHCIADACGYGPK